MRKSGLLIGLVLIAFAGTAQVRVSKLLIKSNEIYSLGQSDIIVADTLVMMNNSRLVLNNLKRENFLRIGVAIIGENCLIDGRGVDGKAGQDGKNHSVPTGPCQDGTAGRNGMRGLDGGPGINLLFYVDRIVIKGKLTISLSGGNGGNGGDGGQGGGGSPGTRHCRGGNGGNGGNGGLAGSGGDGGTLTIGGRDQNVIKGMLGTSVILQNKGGNFGYGGESGSGGPAGLGPSKRNGKNGARGTEGPNGKSGNMGTVIFEEI